MSEPVSGVLADEKHGFEAGASETDKFRQAMGHVSRQSSVFFAGTIFTTGAGYFFKIYLARVLHAEGLGIFALGMTITGLFGTFASLGLPQAAAHLAALAVAVLAYFMISTMALLRNLNLNRAIAVAARKPTSVAMSTVVKVTMTLLRKACQKFGSCST